MALGQRLVADLMVEISFHLIDIPTVQTLAANVNAGTPATITLDPSSPLTLPAAPQFPTSCLYTGAQVVVGWQNADAEVATVIEVLSGTQFTANLVNNHSAGETIFGATFAAQQPTDPVFTQSEILGYIAQAQNEFLTRVPLILSFFNSQLIQVGATYQTLPADAIELERVTVQSNPASTTFAISAITRSGGTVTATLATTANTDQWTPALPIQVYGVTDSSFDTASQSTSPATNGTVTLATISADGLTLTWAQAGADATSSGGFVSRPVYTRLYESSQEQLSMNQPLWPVEPGLPPSRWAEDRAGAYGWLAMPPPSSNFYMSLLCSTRATETLGLLDGFAVPDLFVYAIKWRALSFAWSKAGVQRSASMAKFAEGKFNFYCLLADRFLRAASQTAGVR